MSTATKTKRMYLTTTKGNVTSRTSNIRVVTYKDVTSGSTTKGTPYVKLTVTDPSEAATEINFWTTEKAMKYTLLNVERLLTATGMTSEAAKAHFKGVTTNTELAKKLSVVVGKLVKMSFIGIISGASGEYLNVEMAGVASVNTPDNEMYMGTQGKDQTDEYVSKKNGTTTTSSTSGSALQPNPTEWMPTTSNATDDLPF